MSKVEESLLVWGEDEELTWNMPKPEGASVVSIETKLVGRRFKTIYYPENEINEEQLKGLKKHLYNLNGELIPYNSSMNLL